jgi:hypothetical protein
MIDGVTGVEVVHDQGHVIYDGDPGRVGSAA